MATTVRSTIWFLRGLSEFTKSGYDKAAKSFKPNALDVDLHDKVLIVTGANSGIGKQVALEYAKRGGVVHMLCRNRDRAEQAKQEIVGETKNENVHVHIVDMGSPKEIQQFVNHFTSTSPNLHVLVNNAGCMVNERKETPDGLEENFATNTLGVYVLTTLLLDTLKKTPSSRVVTVSSGGMYNVALDVDDLQSLKHFDGTFAYAQQKRQQVELTNLWANKYGKTGIQFFSCHPGWADTPAVRSSMPSFHKMMEGRLRSEAEGADTVVWLAIAKESELATTPNGSFVQDRKVVAQHLPFAGTATNPQDVEKLILSLDGYMWRILGNQSTPKPTQ